jgi:hypothetical protein
MIADSRPVAVDRHTGRVLFELVYAESSKTAWKHLLGWKPVLVTAGWDGDGPFPFVKPPRDGAPAATPATNFVVAPDAFRLAVFVALFVALAVGFVVLAVRSNVLRNKELVSSTPGTAPYSFSLGRAQMAWWTFIVLASVLFVWLMTGRFSVTGQLLILMGISSATALGAVIVDASKQSAAAVAAQAALGEVAQAQAAVNDAAAAAALAAAGPAAATLEHTRSVLQRFAAQLTRKAAALARDAAPPPTTRNFLRDILSDADGVSLHRFQVVTWTLALGLYFVFEVFSRFEMPALSAELLTLMGISNSAYLGFKFPERRQS